MITKVHMEALSPTMEEGQLVRWVKAEGDAVSNGDILAEIETDKATMELVARGEGVLRKVLLAEGDTAPVGEVIAVIADAGEDIGELEGAGGGASEEDDAKAAEESKEGKAATQEEAGKAAEVDEDTEDAPEPEKSEPGAAEGPPPAEGDEDRIKASPLARRLAEEAGISLARIPGSGPGGRVVKRDVEEVRTDPSALKPAVGEADQAAAAGALGGPGGYRVGPSGGPDYEDVPLSQMRKTIAKRLVESISPVPHFFLRIEVEMRRVLEARQRVNALLEADGLKVSINDFILKALAQALSVHPEVNANWNEDSIRRHHRVHLGVAVAVDDGLITPVIRDANLKGLAQISQEVRELAARGREKKLQPEEYTGSTFSLSNLGMFGIHEFTGVINPPEAGILAVGGVEETPMVEDGEVVVQPMMKVTMSCDHRVIDGATGARFLQTFKAMLEEPAAILL